MHFKGYVFRGYQTFTCIDRETVKLEFYNKRQMTITNGGHIEEEEEEEEFIFHIITNNMQCNYCKINVDNVEGYRKSRGHQSRLPHIACSLT